MTDDEFQSLMFRYTDSHECGVAPLCSWTVADIINLIQALEAELERRALERHRDGQYDDHC